MILHGIPIDVWLEGIFRRPRMYFEPMTTTRDLICFARGFYAGAHPPHGDGLGTDFAEFLYRKHGRTPPAQLTMLTGDFAAELLEEYGDKPALEVCEKIADLFAEYRTTRSKTES
jgi:hypothetical protein